MTGVPQLDPGLSNVLFAVWLVSRAVNATIDGAISDTGLDADEFAVYSVLAQGEGMTPTDLSRWMTAPGTTVSSYVKRFEQRGHVERQEHPDDGRSYLIQLTADGREAHRAAGARFLPLLANVNRVLGPDVNDVHQRLTQLHAAVTTPTT
ncbi:MAG: MarR family transcriptional regulator [Actinomycetota bacterium]